jgi:hypothetical protein
MPLILANGSVVTVVQPIVGSVTVQCPALAVVEVVAVPAGASFSEVAFEYIQLSPASAWVIPMPGNWPSRRPDVTLYVSDVEIESDVVWTPGIKTITVTFPSPTSGVALIT